MLFHQQLVPLSPSDHEYIQPRKGRLYPSTITREEVFSFKEVAIGAGVVFAVSHIGLLGYVLRPQESPVQQPPTFNLPRGPYSSYRIKLVDGYEIEYRADDPKVLSSERSLDVDKNERMVWW